MLYLSYTREDALFAVQLADDLEALGVEVWLDLYELGPEIKNWSAALEAAIAASEGVILILSPEATEREHIQRELRQIHQSDTPVYLAVARASPWRDWLRGLPYADFTADYEIGLSHLMMVITGEIGEMFDEDDPAEAFLREAEQSKSPRRREKPRSAEDEQEPEGEKPKSWLRRTLRRLF